MNSAILYGLVGYLLVSYLFLSFVTGERARELGFAVLSAVFCVGLFFSGSSSHAGFALKPVAIAAAMLSLSYLALRTLRERTAGYGLSIAVPIGVLVLAKIDVLPLFVGLSYLAFRLAYLVYEVHSGKIGMPTLAGYVGFALFPLTFVIGPISPYRLHGASLAEPSREKHPMGRCFGRLGVGLVKCVVIAEVFHRLAFKQLWLEGQAHSAGDFLVSCVASYLFLYFNFSGACDVIVGAAGLLEIEVKENFDRPLLARNIRDFWSRFHITLTDVMRDLVFTPGNLALSRRFGMVTAGAAMLMVNFFLVGLWHGVGKNFVALGILHGAAMTVFFLFSVAVKRLPKHLRGYTQTALARTISTTITFTFLSFTSLFFENDWAAFQRVLRSF